MEAEIEVIGESDFELLLISESIPVGDERGEVEGVRKEGLRGSGKVGEGVKDLTLLDEEEEEESEEEGVEGGGGTRITGDLNADEGKTPFFFQSRLRASLSFIAGLR